MEPLRYERIRSLRIDRDLTQREIADMLHIKQNTYSQYETGRLNYPLEIVVALAAFYGTSVDYLLGLTDEKSPSEVRQVAYERIRNLREDKDMSQTELAQVLHCSQRIYSNYERGEVDIPTEILIKLAQFHQTSVDYLLGLTDEMTPYPRRER
jgi:transcriptional regulator with XRE-family HTH domain